MTDFFFHVCWPSLQAEGFTCSDVLFGVEDTLLCLVARCNESHLESSVFLLFQGGAQGAKPSFGQLVFRQ